MKTSDWLNIPLEYRGQPFLKWIICQGEAELSTASWVLVHCEQPHMMMPVSIKSAAAIPVRLYPEAAHWPGTPGELNHDALVGMLNRWLFRTGGYDPNVVDVRHRPQYPGWYIGLDPATDEDFDIVGYVLYCGINPFVAQIAVDSFKSLVYQVRWLEREPAPKEQTSLLMEGLRIADELESLWLFRTEVYVPETEPTLDCVE